MNQKEQNQKIVELLHKDCKLSIESLATMLNMDAVEVAARIDELEKQGAILGYGAIVNWDKVCGSDVVTAYIELRTTPQNNDGFDRIAKRIYQCPQVKALNLMSGSYDFGVTVEGKTIQEIALFVSEHLAPMEAVIGTSTHFVLKRYKGDGVILTGPSLDSREVISI